MNAAITELYTDADLARMQRYIKRWRTALLAVAAAALAACVVMVALTETKNAQRMELATIAVSTLAGWFVLYWAMFTVSPARRELAHARMLRSEERERTEGAVTVTAERFTIRKSVPVRRVEVLTGEQTERFLVSASRAGALAAGVTAVYTVHGYVAAYEVTA